MLCLPLKGMAQGVEMLSDSLVYNIAMYRSPYNTYLLNKQDFQDEIIRIVKREFPHIASKVNLNAKFSNLGIDSLTVRELAGVISREVGRSISEEEVVSLSTVGGLADVLHFNGDPTELIFVYYPWKTVFDTHSVYRVSLYNDGISILKDLIGYTCDSIQREIYINELMNVYDVWYEYADTINASMNETFSKTLIKSNKVRDYIEMYSGEITEENVMHPHYVKMYDYIMDALNEPENQEEVYYLNVDKLMRISVQRLKRAYALNGNYKKYADQYVADFDIFDVRMQLLLDHVSDSDAKGNIVYLHKGHNDQYKKIIDGIDPPSPGDCPAQEEYYASRMLERGMDQMFLDQVIRKLRKCPNSNVYVEALENYTYLSNVDPAEIVDKRRLLVNVYIQRELYDEAIGQIQFLLGLPSLDNIEKAHLHYRWGVILERQGNNQQAAFRYKSAVKLNANHGNAYFRLALMYSKNKFKLGNDEKSLFIDKYKYLLCIDKLEIAKKKIQEYANSGDYGKYNDTELSLIDQLIASFKTNCPDQANAHMFGLDKEYWTSGGSFTFKGGVMNGETTTIRFYY